MMDWKEEACCLPPDLVGRIANVLANLYVEWFPWFTD